ncbi:CehA/McbA family metallohydrolase [Nonomuraea mesophila]|uniref:CehA/McbA family metallohydrolase n=1 Tax=Nonomuraea mesophila TaxID=2530382 RepID=UPI00140DC67C|nr:CehA/McbA family metallohydrolase [Nonomuraea mesophila]
MIGRTELLSVATTLPEPAFDLHYLHYPLDVPDGVGELELVLEYDKIVDVVQIYAVLLEPDGAFRGHVQCPGGPGPRRLVIRVGTDGAGPGCVAGPVPAGRWTVRLDLDRHKAPAPYTLTVHATPASSATPAIGATPATRSAGREARLREPVGGTGWYRGELHSHSTHSDGRRPVADLVRAARGAGLDFLAVTDHFTAAHWPDLDHHTHHIDDRDHDDRDRRDDDRDRRDDDHDDRDRRDDDHDDRDDRGRGGVVLLHSMELTSHRGHANLHGLSRWVDTYVDRPGHTMVDVAADVHEQGGLVCVNHAFSGDQAWRRFDTPWDAIDLIEIAHLQQGANNDAQIGLWDRLLTSGHRVIGVAGSDCHDPSDPGQALGQVVTVVHADEGSERGIVEGLRRGRVYVWRGADIDMRVNRAPMGETAAAPGGRVQVDVDVRADEPVVVFVLRDGLLINVVPAADKPGEWQRITVEDRLAGSACYRAEVHADPGRNDPQFWASSLRDHSSLRAAGNPVWVGTDG